MNWTIYGMECVGALILFTCLIMISLCKNPVWWIHDYPKDIQEKYFETHERIPTEVLSAPVFLKMASINIRFAICPILSPPVQNIKAISPISSDKQKALFVLYPSTATIRAHSKQGTRPSAMPITERTT